MWRALKATHCATLREGVYILPAQAGTAAAFPALEATIRDAGACAALTRLADFVARLGTVQGGAVAVTVAARLEQARTDAQRAIQIQEEIAGYERRGALAQALELDLRSDRFIAFVQREAMQVLASEAADRMEHLSRGRYRMRADGAAPRRRARPLALRFCVLRELRRRLLRCVSSFGRGKSGSRLLPRG